MFFLKLLLGASKDSEIFSKGIEMFVKLGGNYLILPSMLNPIQPLLLRQFDQSFLESYVPGISKQEYSKLLHGIRFALKHMLDDQPFTPGDSGPFWCIEILSLQEFLNRATGQSENLAYVSPNRTRISLPKIIFSSKKNEYFQDLNPDQPFNLNDPVVLQQPTWVLRLKRIWNILFLAEELFQVIEIQPKKLFSTEHLMKMNEAYQLIFELEIDLKGLIQKNYERLQYIYQHYVQSFVDQDNEHQGFVKDMGYFLGLIISQLGSAKGIVDFGLQAQQLSPQVLAWLSHLINQLVQYVSTKSKILVESQRLEKLERNIKKIEKEIKDFGSNPKFSEENLLQLFFELLQFIQRPSRNRVTKLIRHMVIEHETLVIEILRWLKYEAIPFGLGLFEDLENEMMLEPGSLIGPLEVFSQQTYSAYIAYLDFKTHSDLKNLYSQNWFIVREENAYKKWSKLTQNKETLKIYRKYLEDNTIPPLHLFKLFYEDALRVDCQQAENLRKRFQPQVWEALKIGIVNLLNSRLIQIEDQLDSLSQYLDKHRFVKYSSVAYFELSCTHKITYHDLSEVQKAYCQRLHDQSEKNAQIKAYIQDIKIEELQTRLSHLDAKSLWIAPTLLVLFQNEHYLVSIRDDEIASIQIRTNINLGCQPAKNQPIFLSGYMIEKLGLSADGDIQLYEDIPRFSLDIDDYLKPKQPPIEMAELSADELSLYVQGIQIQCKKIENSLARINYLQALLRAQHPPMKLIHSRYYELRGLFKCLLHDDFRIFEQRFLARAYLPDEFEQRCEDIKSRLSDRLMSCKNIFHDVLLRYEIQLVDEKTQRILPAPERAGYLMHTQKYSASLEYLLQRFHAFFYSYASPSLIAELAQLTSERDFDIKQHLELSYAAKSVTYIHNLLFYLKSFYISIEKLKKYSNSDLGSSAELGHRIMSIADYFTFQNFAYSYYPFDVKQRTEGFNQFNPFQSYALMLERFSNVYGLNDQSEYDFLNSSIILQQIIVHLFDDKAIRVYLLEDKKGVDVDDLSHRLVRDELLFDSFDKVKVHDFFREHRLNLINIRLKCLKQEMKLKELATAIQQENKPKNRLQYIIHHSRMKQLQVVLNKKQNEFNQLLHLRDCLFFKILEKNIQHLSHELNPLEHILSNHFFGKELNHQQKKRVKEINTKKKLCVNNQKQIAQIALDISRTSKEWKISVGLFEDLKNHYVEFSSDDKWWFDLNKKIMEQSVFQTQPRLEENEKLSLEMLFSNKAHPDLRMKTLLQRLLISNQKEYLFSQSVLTAKDRLIRKILHAYYTSHEISFNFYEEELLTQYRDSNVFQLLLEYRQERYYLRNHQLSFEEQWIWELQYHPHPLLAPFLKPLNQWSIEAVYHLWPIQSMMMRSDVYSTFQKYIIFKSDITRQDLQKKCNKYIQEQLKLFELLNFRSMYLKEAHQDSRDMMRQYAYIDQKKFLYQLHYLTFSPKYFDFLRNGLRTFREKSAKNIAQISSELISPVMIQLDKFEMLLKLRPGLVSRVIEQYLKIFFLSYAQQISASPLYVPMMIQRRDLVLNNRMACIQSNLLEQGASATQQAVLAYLMIQNQSLEHQQFIFNSFMEYTKLYTNVLQSKYGLLSHVRFKEKLYQFLNFYMLAQIQKPTQVGYIKDDLFQQLRPHIEANTQDGFFEAYCFKTFENYLKPNLHQLEKLNRLAFVLESFEANLSKNQENLIALDKAFQSKSKNGLAWLYKGLIFMPYYYWMTLCYYRFHHLSLIEEKQKQIVTLKTIIHDPRIHEVCQIIENFEDFFEQEHVQKILQKRAVPAWHLFYLLIEVARYFMDCLLVLCRLFLPQSHSWHLTQEESHVDKIKHILEINQQDIKFDYQSSIGMLFKPKTELNAAECHLLRR